MVIPSRRAGDREVAAIGLGGARIAFGPVIPDERSAVRLVHAALDAGVTLLDTADVYSPGSGYSESVFGQAVRTWGPGRDGVLILDSVQAADLALSPGDLAVLGGVTDGAVRRREGNR